MIQSIENNNCYDQAIWRSYHSGFLDESQRIAMEQHLLYCDKCMDIYLDLVAESAGPGESLLSGDFTDKLMQELESQAEPQISPAKVPGFMTSKATVMISYCAAASIAMFFLVGGYFDNLADKLVRSAEYFPPPGMIAQKTEPSRGLIQNGWTQKVLDEKRQPFIENFKRNDKKE